MATQALDKLVEPDMTMKTVLHGQRPDVQGRPVAAAAAEPQPFVLS